MLLRRLVGLTFADTLPHDHLACLQDDSHYFFVLLCNPVPWQIIPKLHFLVHYPRFMNELGPLNVLHTVGFEGTLKRKISLTALVNYASIQYRKVTVTAARGLVSKKRKKKEMQNEIMGATPPHSSHTSSM